MFMKIAPLLVAPFFVTACATASTYEMSDETKATLAKYEATGETRSCLPLTSIDRIKPIDDRNFLIEMRGRDVYISRLSSSCSGASRFNNRLQYETSLSSLCQNEIIRVVDNSSGFTVGSCGLEKFEKLVEKPSADTAE